MYTRYYLLHYVILAFSCRISTCDNETGNSLTTLTDCLKGTTGLSDLQLWIYCRERTETAVSRSDRLAHSSEHDYSGSVVPNPAQIDFKIKSSVSVKDGLLLTKHEGTELSSLDFERSRCGEQDKELCFGEETAASLARVQKADQESGSPDVNQSEKPLNRINDGRGPHSATRLGDAAQVITASTSAVLLLFVIYTLVTVWRRHSAAARISLLKTEREKGAHTFGTVADIHKSHMASSLGRAIALVLSRPFDPKKNGGKECTSERNPEYLAKVLGCEESRCFAQELYAAFQEVQRVSSRLETVSTPVTGGGHQGPSPAGGSAGTQPFQPRRETSNTGQSRGEAVAPDDGMTHTSAADREEEGGGEVGAESLSIESAHFCSHRLESSDGEPPEEWIREQRLRFFDKGQNRGRRCEEGGGALHVSNERAGEWSSGGGVLGGDGDPIHALLPVATRQVALTHAAVRVREAKADKEEGGSSSSSSSVLERLAAAYETRNHLTVAKLRLGSRQLDVQSQQLEVACESNSLMRSSVGIGQRRNELKERAAAEQRAGEALRALIAQLADELVTGLWVMVAALVAAGWWLARDRLGEEAAVCYRSVQTPRSWFRFWTSQWMNELSCQLLIFGRLVFGLAILVLFSSYLVHKDVADMQRRPVFMIIFVMGVLGGYVGNSTVESVGGVGIRWLLCWEALCAFHVAGVWYPKKIFFFVNRCHPEQSGALEGYNDERRQEKLSTKVRKVAIHALIVLVLPLAAGLWPFL